jgi:hypothetical protein
MFDTMRLRTVCQLPRLAAAASCFCRRYPQRAQFNCVAREVMMRCGARNGREKPSHPHYDYPTASTTTGNYHQYNQYSTVLGAGSSTSTCTCTNTVLLVSTGTTGLELLAALELVLHLFAGFAQLPLHRPCSPLMRPLLMKPG